MGYIIFNAEKSAKLYNSLRQGLRPHTPRKESYEMAIEYLRNSTHHGKSAQLANYILRKGQFSEKEDFVCGGEGNLPSWAKDSNDFWNAADASEMRNQNARKERNGKTEKEQKRHDETGKHIIIALPKEFNNEELSEMAQELAEKIAGNNHAYTYGVHINKGVLSDEKNPHFHLFLCTRKIDKNRQEPDRDNYFRKTRSCKDGTINGGYHKDDEIVGSHRSKWTAEKKAEFEEICNRYIEKHNERTGENVKKINFESKKGSKSEHLGNKAISRKLRGRNSKKVQTELDRRIELAAKAEAAKILKAEKETIQKSINLPILDRIRNRAISFIENPLNAAERAKNREKREIEQKIQKMTLEEQAELAENTEKNAEMAKNIIHEKAERISQNLQKEAKKRGIHHEIQYSPSLSTTENLTDIAIKSKVERESLERKIEIERIEIEKYFASLPEPESKFEFKLEWPPKEEKKTPQKAEEAVINKKAVEERQAADAELRTAKETEITQQKSEIIKEINWREETYRELDEKTEAELNRYCSAAEAKERKIRGLPLPQKSEGKAQNPKKMDVKPERREQVKIIRKAKKKERDNGFSR